MDQEFDLWGEPIPPRVEKRGRPAHEVTNEKRQRVAVLRALNFTSEQIADAMGISDRTLRGKYLPELKAGRATMRAKAMVRLFELAMDKGNVSALKEFLRQAEKSDLVMAPPVMPAKTPKLGKKEQAVIDASLPDASSSMGSILQQRAAMTGRVH